jgi:tetratricopeptide (TPR) repeat protein
MLRLRRLGAAGFLLTISLALLVGLVKPAISATPSTLEPSIEALESRSRTHPQDPATLHDLAEALLMRARVSQAPGDYQRAGVALARALQLAPDHPRSLALKAWSEMNEHRFRDALIDAQAALQSDPTAPIALGLAADAATELGAYDQAIEFTERLLSRHPGLPGLTRAAHLRFVHGDLAGALELAQSSFNAVRRGSLDAVWSLLQLSELSLADGQFELAERTAHAAREMAPDLPQPLAQLARVAEARADFTSALAWYRQANALHTNPEYVLGILRAALATGDVSETRRQRAILSGMAKLDEVNGGLYARVFAEFRLLERDFAGAELLARRELERRPDIYSHSQLAWILLARGEVTAALPYADKSMSTSSADPLLAYRSGHVFDAAGQTERGAQLIQRARALNPGLAAMSALRVPNPLAGAKPR